jgi:glycosyltransferase involved in cell wall biosynthesis
MNHFRATVVVPARNEHQFINTFLDRIDESVTIPVEVLIVVDAVEDSTIAAVGDRKSSRHNFKIGISNTGVGPANAIRYGFREANSNVLVVTMADGSDDPRAIDELILLVERGCAIACASRYMPGGQQIGGPRFKKFLSRNASRILRIGLGVGTHDSTNSFKAYSKEFIDEVGLESIKGFELGIELVAKAHRRGRIIAEIPTIWINRTVGESNFQLRKWLPQYMKWFFYSFGLKK